jgi:hypothetical protein
VFRGIQQLQLQLQQQLDQESGQSGTALLQEGERRKKKNHRQLPDQLKQSAKSAVQDNFPESFRGVIATGSSIKAIMNNNLLQEGTNDGNSRPMACEKSAVSRLLAFSDDESTSLARSVHRALIILDF